MSEKEEKNKSEVAKREEMTLSFWNENKVFEASLNKQSPKGDYVFYDGPPFATGLPHYGNLLSSIIKDVVPRYKTMNGYHVRRRWGWDCHGLPIENMIEKDLGLTSKKDIEELGISKFCESCRDKVLMYTDEWERYISRIARWVEFKNSYKTMDSTFTESVWWAIKEMHKKDLVYEGRKVLLYCTHCETPVSKAETNMDDSYKDVADDSITTKFKVTDPESHNLPANTSILAWTTTPWTMPANMGLAVDNELNYSVVKEGDETYILAEALVEKVFEGREYEIVQTVKGKELVDINYEPLYKVPKVGESGKRGYYIMPADFVTTEDGTGVVHTAVIYGEEDYQLGMEYDLPMIPLLTPNGHFNDDAPDEVRGLFWRKANKVVIEDLKERGLLFSDEKYTHSYPHCWRCKNPLIYNAISAWFINIQKVKERMKELNQDINWYPAHLKDGRFGKILEGAPDWNISRNRFWATPLPMWKCGDCDNLEVIGSVSELAEKMPPANNSYIAMRHAEAECNVKKITCTTVENPDSLTETGKEQAREEGKKLKEEKIDLIFHSDFTRTTETAKIVAEELGLAKEKVIADKRLREVSVGDHDGGNWPDFWKKFNGYRERFLESRDGSEPYIDVYKRVAEAIYEYEEKYQGKRILIITHGIGAFMLHVVKAGGGVDRYVAMAEMKKKMGSGKQDEFDVDFDYSKGEWHELGFKALPHDKNYEVDLHKHYVDPVKLVCSCGGEMSRIPEVVDCWLESGSMPFAEYNYPFFNKEEFERNFPSDFIAEYVGQTRTWFYYMLVVSGVLFDQASFKNVVVTGNILAADGTKMSKSLGNYTDPFMNIDRYGADALRYYLMSSPLMRGEDINFKDEELKEVYQRLINILWNVVQFFVTYRNLYQGTKRPEDSPHVLDKWIVARLNQLTDEVTKGFESYDTPGATRPFREFVTDLSTWYTRRSRDRFKGNDEEDRQYALATTQHVLEVLSKLMAPVTPYIAEQIYQEVKNTSDGELSVHLCDWPKNTNDIDESVIEKMEKVRKVVSLALEKRATAGIKVRQPLAKLSIGIGSLDDQYVELIKDEVNVKEVEFSVGEVDEVTLDTELTPELKEEGQVREFVRYVQSLRKEAKLSPQEEISVTVTTDEAGLGVLSKFKDEVQESVKASELALNKGATEKDLDGLNVTVSLG